MSSKIIAPPIDLQFNQNEFLFLNEYPYNIGVKYPQTASNWSSGLS